MKIGFLGAGRMAQALSVGIGKRHSDVEFLVSDPNDSAVHSFGESIALPWTRVSNNSELATGVDVLFIAVKPQAIEVALSGIDLSTANSPLIVSVVAGTTLETLQSLTGSRRIARVMPNTPCLIGQGASAMAASHLETADQDLAKQLLETVGIVEAVPESYLDAVTGLSGSGPAYVFNFIEALSDGGVLMGLPRETATRLATQTVIGAAALVMESGEHTAVLRERVASPGGTTIAGLQALESNGFRASVMAGVEAATRRSKELG